MSHPRLYNDHELELLASSLEQSASRLRARAAQFDAEREQFHLRMRIVLHALRSFVAHNA